MSNYPSISKPLGVLTVSMWGRIMDMLQSYELKTSDESVVQTTLEERVLELESYKPWCVARITGSAEIGGGSHNQFYYSWHEVSVENDADGIVSKENGLSGTTSTFPAINLCERSNLQYNVGTGVDLGGADYPEGFSMMPIGKCGDDTLVNVSVIMFLVPSLDGVIVPCFSIGNSHDGTCT